MQEHGDISIDWSDNLLIIEPKGPFNAKGQKRAIDIVKKSIEDQDHKQWKRLEIWGELTIGSPEVLEMVNEFYIWCSKNGCIAAAVVANLNVHEFIVNQFLSNKIQIFPDYTTAKQWLDEQ